MAENWQDFFVADIASPVKNALVGGPFGSNLVSKDYVETGIPVIRGQNMGERWISGEFVFVSEEKAKQLSPNTARPGDLIFTQRGTLGQVAIVPEKQYDSFIISQSQMKLTVDKEKADALFIYYAFKSPEQQDYILRNAIQTGVPHTNLEHLRTTSIFLPPLPEQRAIAGILGALDDKIELNRRMNRTLESLARAVFQEMMKSEGGRMNGRETTIGEVVTIVGGSTPSTTNPVFWEGGHIHWATPKDLAPLQSPVLLHTNSQITELGLREISSGLLPIGTVLLSSRAPIGYLAITQIPTAINQGFIAIKCTEEAPNYFILNWLKDSMEEIIGRANGTTFLEISKSNFRPMPIFIPSSDAMKQFVKTVEPLYQKIVANLKESRMLASLRDSLLPKLMRGEVRVKDVEHE
ncbi:MAG: restriction endonuclease subunit S [Bacteroidetes bacterium]|nr:restriction endonuclease subunit S [Bacteroidota bacterium]